MDTDQDDEAHIVSFGTYSQSVATPADCGLPCLLPLRCCRRRPPPSPLKARQSSLIYPLTPQVVSVLDRVAARLVREIEVEMVLSRLRDPVLP